MTTIKLQIIRCVFCGFPIEEEGCELIAVHSGIGSGSGNNWPDMLIAVCGRKGTKVYDDLGGNK